jgi:hypothetical protein
MTQMQDADGLGITGCRWFAAGVQKPLQQTLVQAFFANCLLLDKLHTTSAVLAQASLMVADLQKSAAWRASPAGKRQSWPHDDWPWRIKAACELSQADKI